MPMVIGRLTPDKKNGSVCLAYLWYMVYHNPECWYEYHFIYLPVRDSVLISV